MFVYIFRSIQEILALETLCTDKAHDASHARTISDVAKGIYLVQSYGRSHKKSTVAMSGIECATRILQLIRIVYLDEILRASHILLIH